MAPFRRAEWPGQRCRGGNLPPERIRAERGELRYQPYLHSPGQTLPAFIGFPTPPCAVPARPGTPGPWGERGGNDGFGHGAIALFYKWAIQSAASAKGYRSPITVFVVVHRFPPYLKTDSWTIMIRLPLCAEYSCPIRYRIFFVPRDFGVAKSPGVGIFIGPQGFFEQGTLRHIGVGGIPRRQTPAEDSLDIGLGQSRDAPALPCQKGAGSQMSPLYGPPRRKARMGESFP